MLRQGIGKVMRRVFVNAVIVAAACLIGAFICEFAARYILNPADYLSVEMIPDQVLGAIPSPSIRGAGLDAWGFRNREVPEHADIVAIGDSHTYGNAATMNDAWPRALGDSAGLAVYNMGMGGYGPNQYYALLKTNALRLRPKIVICGLYMGDDFENAFSITYGLDHWAQLRKDSTRKANFDIWQASPEAVSWNKSVRVWLSRHSVLYQIVFHGPLMGALQGETQIKNAARLYDAVTSLDLPDQKILEAFRPASMLSRLDQTDSRVQEGMRITFQLLKEMDRLCREQGVGFMVVVIPTKEMVFSGYLEHNSKLPMSDVVDKLLFNERAARDKTFGYLTEAGIPYVDTLPLLKTSVQNQLYARTAADMHPNGNGYRVIARAVSDALNGAELPSKNARF
jgi:hypothetical protein